jgi:hypothetical protein
VRWTARTKAEFWRGRTRSLTEFYGTPDDEESIATIHRAIGFGVKVQYYAVHFSR